MKTANINLNECVKNKTLIIKVSGIKTFTLRIKAGVLLLKLAAKLLPFNTNVEVENK